MLKDRYVFPALFQYEKEGISVFFPDFEGCVTSGENTEDAISMAKDLLPKWLIILNEKGKTIPEPSDVSIIEREKNQAVVLIDVWMPPHVDHNRNRSVKKNCTIPQWLDDIAKKQKINYSELLQTALKQHLNIQDRHE